MKHKTTDIHRGVNLPSRRHRLMIPCLSMGPSAMLAQTAGYYACDITVHCGSRNANAKSMMSLITLGAHEGEILTITANGPDAEDALDALLDIFDTRFGEENMIPANGASQGVCA